MRFEERIYYTIIYMKTKFIKYIGSLLMVLSILFVVVRLRRLDINYRVIVQKNNIYILLFLSILYGIHIYLLSYSWSRLIKMITGKSISFLETAFVWNKSNMMKYIPGNVFQYIGRNEIAIIENLNHLDVALATIVDVLINLLGVFMVVLITYAQGIGVGIKLFLDNKYYVLIAGGIIFVVGVLLISFKKKLASFLERIKVVFVKKNIPIVCKLIIFYSFWAVYTGLIYICILYEIVGISLTLNNVSIIIGAYLMSWMIGFVMPGAPGGIGVREVAITLMLLPYNEIDINDILLAIVIYRLVNIIGDLLGMAASYCSYILAMNMDKKVKEKNNKLRSRI